MSGSALRRALGTLGGVGWLPVAPGTWGSFATVLLFAALFGVAGWGEGLLAGLLPAAPLPGIVDGAAGGPGSPGAPVSTGASIAAWLRSSPWIWPALVAAALAALFAVGVRIGTRAPEDHGSADPGAFVLDELVGQGLALLPLLPGPLDPLGLAVAFAAFRVADVLKPPPCRALERLPGGLGIMADDAMAGAYAAALVLILPWALAALGAPPL